MNYELIEIRYDETLPDQRSFVNDKIKTDLISFTLEVFDLVRDEPREINGSVLLKFDADLYDNEDGHNSEKFSYYDNCDVTFSNFSANEEMTREMQKLVETDIQEHYG
jgi:hypothetical protein